MQTSKQKKQVERGDAQSEREYWRVAWGCSQSRHNCPSLVVFSTCANTRVRRQGETTNILGPKVLIVLQLDLYRDFDSKWMMKSYVTGPAK